MVCPLIAPFSQDSSLQPSAGLPMNEDIEDGRTLTPASDLHGFPHRVVELGSFSDLALAPSTDEQRHPVRHLDLARRPLGLSIHLLDSLSVAKWLTEDRTRCLSFGESI
ncbi:MAG: hypothetical protein AB4290_07495 [Spirulina sp.]